MTAESPISPSQLTPLPHALIESIFTYATIHPDHRGLGQVRTVVPPELKTVALVSREWNQYASDVASAITLRRLTLEIPGNRSRRCDILELRRRVTLRRAYLRELELKDANNSFQRPPTSRVVLSMDQWRVVCSHMPQLQALNLKWLARADSERISSIVKAVRAHCPLLQTLVMPPLQPTRTGRVNEPTANTRALLDAVLTTPTNTSGIALRELRLGVPTVRHQNPHELAIQYLAQICDVCPNLEQFNGYADMLDQIDKLNCDEQWQIDVKTWERFCATLTQLKSFDWVVVPFATLFFEIFGRYPKPQLTKLVFSTPMNWNWSQYRANLSIPRGATGYGATARNAHAALKACPALQDLEVAVYLPGDGGDEEDDDVFGWDIYGGFHGQQQQRRPPVPEESMMDQDIFGDEFCEAVAKHCRQLEKFTIWRVLQNSTVSHTVMAFTDRAMRALATLPRLRWLELKSVNITGDGLFSLAAFYARNNENPTLQRECEITVGDDASTPTEMAFYDVVEGFLTKLATYESGQLPCASRRVALRLHNGCFKRVDRQWSEAYLTRVRALAKSAIATHSSVKIRILTRGYRHGDSGSASSCDEIVEFGFSTVHATVNEWWGWENEPQDTRVDDVVVNRGPLASASTRQVAHNEDEEDDDDEDEDGDEDEDMDGDY